MSQSPIHEPYPTVRAVLKDTLYAGGTEGCSAFVYPFPQSMPQLQGYLLREEKACPVPSPLRHSTALTPVRQLVQGIHIGQPLMALNVGDKDYITLVARQRDYSFAAFMRNLSADPDYPESCIKPRKQLMDRLLSLAEKTGVNPFLSIMQQAYDVGISGKAIDLHGGNVFLEGDHLLCLIDQLEEQEPSALGQDPTHSVEQMLKTESHKLFDRTFRAYNPTYGEAWQKVQHLIDDAAENVIKDRRVHPEKPKGLVFAKVDDIQAVGLDAPPHMLVERLKQLEQRAGIKSYSTTAAL